MCGQYADKLPEGLSRMTSLRSGGWQALGGVIRVTMAHVSCHLGD